MLDHHIHEEDRVINKIRIVLALNSLNFVLPVKLYLKVSPDINHGYYIYIYY